MVSCNRSGITPVATLTLILMLGLIVACGDAAPTTAQVEIFATEPASVTLQVGQTQRFTVTALDRFENPVPGLEITFTAREGVGRVDKEGNFIAGTRAGVYPAAVTVEATHGSVTKTATSDVTITPSPLDHVVLKPVPAAVQAGQSQQFTAKARDRFGNAIPSLTYVFRAEEEAGQMDVDGGMFTAGTKAATYSEAVTVEVTEGSVTRGMAADLIISHGPLDGVVITPHPAYVARGLAQQFSAVGLDLFGNRTSDTTFTWSVEIGGGTISADGIFTADKQLGTYGHTVKATTSLGGATRAARATVIVILGEGTAVSVGNFHTCALNTKGGVECWGTNDLGQLGVPTRDIWATTPVNVVGLTRGVVAISVGAEHACALTTAGGVRCWGENRFGQLGDGTTTNRATPVDVMGLTRGVAAISAGGNHTCALTTAGAVKCWGKNRWANGFGQLGDGTTTDRSRPVDVIGLTGEVVVAISAGGGHTCAVTAGGGLKCWGAGFAGFNRYQGTLESPAAPVVVTGLPGGVAAVSAGNSHTCAVTTAGHLKCWGSNLRGQLGDGTITYRATPVDVVGLTSGVAAVSAGGFHTCALTTSGEVKCWGANAYGQLGGGPGPPPTNQTTPVDLFNATMAAAAVSAGDYHTCVLTTADGIRCWGWNTSGQLGDGTTNPTTFGDTSGEVPLRAYGRDAYGP
jgi:alpha-tubulin suppressor-like RCC1 family protein